MAEHTPGPWRWLDSETLVGDHGRRPVVLTAHDDGGLLRRGEDGLLCPLDPKSPDARLIASAPELLAALLGLVTVYQAMRLKGGKVVHDTDPQCNGEWTRALDAIAKAEGRS